MTIIINKKKVPSTWKKNSLYLTSCNLSGKLYKNEIKLILKSYVILIILNKQLHYSVIKRDIELEFLALER